MGMLHSIYDAPEALGAERVARGSAMGPEQARGISQAWTELALALAEPLEAREFDASAWGPRQLALDLFVKAIKKTGLRAPLDEERLLVFGAARHAAERAARNMGLGADEMDQLWETAFGVYHSDLESDTLQKMLSAAQAEVNKKTRFSESLAWSMAESHLMEQMSSVCDEKNGPWRLTMAAERVAQALDEFAGVADAGPRARRARPWMSDREAKILQAALEAVSAITRVGSDIDPSPSGEAALDESLRRLGSRAPFLKELARASQEANAKQRPGPNVKSRKIG